MVFDVLFASWGLCRCSGVGIFCTVHDRVIQEMVYGGRGGRVDPKTPYALRALEGLRRNWVEETEGSVSMARMAHIDVRILQRDRQWIGVQRDVFRALLSVNWGLAIYPRRRVRLAVRDSGLFRCDGNTHHGNGDGPDCWRPYYLRRSRLCSQSNIC